MNDLRLYFHSLIYDPVPYLGQISQPLATLGCFFFALAGRAEPVQILSPTSDVRHCRVAASNFIGSPSSFSFSTSGKNGFVFCIVGGLTVQGRALRAVLFRNDFTQTALHKYIMREFVRATYRYCIFARNRSTFDSPLHRASRTQRAS